MSYIDSLIDMVDAELAEASETLARATRIDYAHRDRASRRTIILTRDNPVTVIRGPEHANHGHDGDGRCIGLSSDGNIVNYRR